MAPRVAPPIPAQIPAQNQPHLANNIIDDAHVADVQAPQDPDGDGGMGVPADVMVIADDADAPAPKGKGGAPKKDLDYYVSEYRHECIIKNPKVMRGPDGLPIESIICGVCTRNIKIMEDTKNKLDIIKQHIIGMDHKKNVAANKGYIFILLLSFLSFSYRF
jgi:hypothetical protein